MNNIALVIGLNQDRAGRSPPLIRAEGDARAVFRQLHRLTIDRKRVFPKGRRILLAGAKATSRSIGLVLAGSAPDLLLVYYSGAMWVDPARPDDPGHLLTYDGETARDVRLRWLIDGCTSRTFVLLLDVVLIGEMDDSRTAAGLVALAPRPGVLPGGYSLLAACSSAPVIKEPQSVSRGVFTAVLLPGLSDNAALDRPRGELRLEQLARYARTHLLELTDRPPLLRYSAQGQVPLLARRAITTSPANRHAANLDAERVGGPLRCSRCDSPSSLGSLYLCERCGELYCARCVGQRGNAGGGWRRCACGGRVI